MKKIIFLFSILSLCSCDKTKPQISEIFSKNCAEIPVDISSPETPIMSDKLDKIFYIKLETKRESIIGFIEKVICDDNKIFVLDKKTESVFIFDFKGKFQNKINSKGSGPNEYIFLEDFNVNKEKKRIEISDSPRKRVLFFDYQGKFIGEQKFNKRIYHYFISNSQGEFLFHNQKAVNNAIIDHYNSKGKLLESYFKSTDHSDYYNSFIELHNPVSLKDDKMCFVLNGNEGIYAVEKDSCKELYRFVFGKNKYSDMMEEFYKTTGDDVIQNFSDKYHLPFSIENLFFGDTYFTVNMLVTPSLLCYYYNMQTGKGFLVKDWVLKGRLALIPGFTVGVNKDFFITSYESNYVMRFYEEINRNGLKSIDPEGFNEIKNIYLQTKPEDNPILMFYKIKH